ncbi:MAG: tetratricopeptide repeat protein [Deltaproteobacteria bacterium]|nr:tetratricopeptide repeat protein [Deltaproteobacteria bacterium]
MIRALVIVLALAPAVSHAQGEDTADAHLARARDLHAKGDYSHARDELQAAYALDPRPELLFALGQVELNLGHYQAAIDYYEKFIATNPAEDQATLAQQAIGAARLELDRPPPPPPPPPPKPAPPKLYAHRWDSIDTTFVAVGGLAALVGGALLYDAHALDDDHSGTLKQYDDRFARAQTRRIEGIVGISAGVALAAAALVRWRVTEVEVHLDVRGDGGALTVGRAW